MEGDIKELAKRADALLDAISDEELIALARKFETELFGSTYMQANSFIKEEKLPTINIVCDKDMEFCSNDDDYLTAA
jgi:hypothetical protein